MNVKQGYSCHELKSNVFLTQILSDFLTLSTTFPSQLTVTGAGCESTDNLWRWWDQGDETRSHHGQHLLLQQQQQGCEYRNVKITTSNSSSGGLETSQRFDMSSRGERRRRALVWSIWTISQASRSGIIEMFMVVFFCFFVDIDGQTIKTIIKTYFPFPRLILTMGSGSVFKQGKLNLCKKNMDLLSRRNRRRSWWTYCSRSLPLILCLMHPSLFYLPTRYHTQITQLMVRSCKVPT